MPEQKTVLAITSGTRDLQGVMNVVWEHVLGGVQEAALPADGAGQGEARQEARRPRSHDAGGTADLAAGRPRCPADVDLPANDEKIESVRLDFGRDAATISLASAGKQSQVACGFSSWKRGGLLPGGDGEPQPVAGSGAWTDDETYTARLYFHETPFRVTATFRFAGDALVLDREQNVALGDAPTKRPTLVGRLVAKR